MTSSTVENRSCVGGTGGLCGDLTWRHPHGEKNGNAAAQAGDSGGRLWFTAVGIGGRVARATRDDTRAAMLTRVTNGFWHFVNPGLMSMFVVVWSDGDQLGGYLPATLITHIHIIEIGSVWSFVD